ncbi:MAG: response regulator [Bacteroidota bacterium]
MSAPNNFKILVIDTDVELLMALELVLKEEGFEVVTSNNSAKAILLAEKENPQLILVELLMPELDGIDICIELKKKPTLINTMIVFHTDRNEDYSQIAAFNAGADDYIIKPVKARVLVSRFKSIIKTA